MVIRRRGPGKSSATVSDALLKPFFGLLFGLGRNTSVSSSISGPPAGRPGPPWSGHRASILDRERFRGAPIYCIGIAVRSGRCQFLTESVKRRPAASAQLLFATLVPLAWMNGRVDLASMITGRSLLLFHPAALVGGLGIVSVGLALRNQTFPRLHLFSAESLPIMALHLVFIALGKLVLLFLLPEADLMAFSSSLFLTFFAVASSLPAVFALDRFAPWLTGRRRGSATDVLRSASMSSMLDAAPPNLPRRLSTGNSAPS